MTKNEKVSSYEDKKYLRDTDLKASLQQAYEDFKHEVNGMHGWNKLISDLEGVVVKVLGNDKLRIVCHYIEVGTPNDLAMLPDNGKKKIKEIEKGLKKHFKNITGKALTLKSEAEIDTNYEKISRLQSDTSWMLGSSRHGDSRAVGKYLIRNSCDYTYSSSLE